MISDEVISTIAGECGYPIDSTQFWNYKLRIWTDPSLFVDWQVAILQA